VRIFLAIAHYTDDPANADTLMRCLIGWRGLATHGEQDFGGPCKAEQVHDLDILVVDDGTHSAMEYVPSELAERVIVDSRPLRLPLVCRTELDKRSQGYDLIGYSEHDNWPITPDAFGIIAGHAWNMPSSVLIPHRFERIMQPPYKVYIDGPNGYGAYGAMWLVTADQWAHWRGQPHFLTYTEAFAGPLESGCAWSLTKTFHCVKPATFGALESEHVGDRYARRSVARGVVWTS
jgi:hypothetical protein